jgi:hypothetical protein
MNASRPAPSSADVATEVANLSAGLGILTISLFPFALPALVLVIVPLMPLAIVGALVAIPFILPPWLFRTVRRARGRGGDATARPGSRSRQRELASTPRWLIHE